MSETKARGGYGTLLQRGGTLVSDPYVTVGEVVKLSGGGVEVGEDDGTHMQSDDGHYEGVPLMAKVAPIVAEIHFAPDDTMQDTLQDDAETVPQPKRFWKVTWPPWYQTISGSSQCFQRS